MFLCPSLLNHFGNSIVGKVPRPFRGMEWTLLGYRGNRHYFMFIKPWNNFWAGKWRGGYWLNVLPTEYEWKPLLSWIYSMVGKFQNENRRNFWRPQVELLSNLVICVMWKPHNLIWCEITKINCIFTCGDAGFWNLLLSWINKWSASPWPRNDNFWTQRNSSTPVSESKRGTVVVRSNSTWFSNIYPF